MDPGSCDTGFRSLTVSEASVATLVYFPVSIRTFEKQQSL